MYLCPTELPLVDMFRTINWANLSLELEELTNNLEEKSLLAVASN